MNQTENSHKIFFFTLKLEGKDEIQSKIKGDFNLLFYTTSYGNKKS
jgi:hypothetical protein